MLETRFYFIMGDILSVTASGGVVAAVCFALIPPEWNMFLAMFLGMAIGMIISLITSAAIFVRYFGAMEIMVPTMLGGMFSGMFVSMAISMTELNYVSATGWGVAIGLIALVSTYLLNAKLLGTQSIGN